MRLLPAIMTLCLALAASSVAVAQGSFMERDMCVRCHLLGPNLGAPNPVLSWRRSAHFRPDSSCADCHGGDRHFYAGLQRGHIGLFGPDETVEMCGECHPRETALQRGRAPVSESGYKCTVSCVHCHGYHEVEESDTGLINERTCGRCHAFDKAAAQKKALDAVTARMELIEKRVRSLKEERFPSGGAEIELAKAGEELSETVHGKRTGKFQAAAAGIIDILDDAEGMLERASPTRWYLLGAAVMVFLGTVMALLSGYEATLYSIDSDKEGDGMSKDNVSEPGGSSEAPPRAKSSWTAVLALVVALAALFLAMQQRFMGAESGVKAVSHTITEKVMPGLNKAEERTTISSVYKLKRMVVTLEEIGEASKSQEVRTNVNRLKSEVEDLAVKVMVHE